LRYVLGRPKDWAAVRGEMRKVKPKNEAVSPRRIAVIFAMVGRLNWRSDILGDLF
jgi:hypothetical protein